MPCMTARTLTEYYCPCVAHTHTPSFGLNISEFSNAMAISLGPAAKVFHKHRLFTKLKIEPRTN